jgi:hypothetical protein
MRNWIKKENENYFEFFHKNSKNFQELRNSFSYHVIRRDDKGQYFWNYNEFSYVLIKENTGNGYGIWKREGTCLPEFILNYNTPHAQSDIVAVVPSPEGKLALIVTAIKGTESNAVQIFDCVSSKLLGRLIKNISYT